MAAAFKLGDLTIGNKMVVVVWRDAASKDEWHGTKENATGSIVCTAGYLVDETRDDIVVSHTLAPNGDGWDTCCSIAIPKGCVLNAFESKDFHNTLVRRRRREPKK